ncbi:D-tyrosyl-tRNA deacylase [Phyllosticta citriasiana]|uniref:D-aminoacyl-tRNA deacylase n=1 Tax=Phyllosticta citriasiana TaxID=595635 RepID=A0ABR1KLY6_9PEZI
MKAVLQRVKSASVTVDGKLISSIGRGLLVFAAVGKDDTPKECERMADKVLKLQMWDDETAEEKKRKWKKNVRDIGGEVLCVSQFTLLASTKKGNKPSFHRSAAEDQARGLYNSFFKKVQDLYDQDKVKDGIFQAMMDVALVNDGPVGVDYHCEDEAVTLEIDTDPPKMDTPGEKGASTNPDRIKLEELMTKIGRIQKEYHIPAELLE